LSGRLTAKGVGFRENIVGLGTDDVRDAQDRRVSFKFRDCGGWVEVTASARARSIREGASGCGTIANIAVIYKFYCRSIKSE
jgi:hypothetical protein